MKIRREALGRFNKPKMGKIIAREGGDKPQLPNLRSGGTRGKVALAKKRKKIPKNKRVE